MNAAAIKREDGDVDAECLSDGKIGGKKWAVFKVKRLQLGTRGYKGEPTCRPYRSSQRPVTSCILHEGLSVDWARPDARDRYLHRNVRPMSRGKLC